MSASQLFFSWFAFAKASARSSRSPTTAFGDDGEVLFYVGVLNGVLVVFMMGLDVVYLGS